MKALKVSKRSTERDTDTKTSNDFKDRWLRIKMPQPELPELDHIFDLYWGGPERRITGLTLRIISVNAVALIMLLFGILYLGQYQNTIIKEKLSNFETELRLISHALSEVEPGDTYTTERLLGRFSASTGQKITIFSPTGEKITNSDSLAPEDFRQFVPDSGHAKKEFSSIRLLKDMAGFIIGLLPDTRTLPAYPDVVEDRAESHPDAALAQEGYINLSAWQDKDGEIMLTAAAPIIRNDSLAGVVLLKRDGADIEESLGQLWSDILRIFLGTLLITILLSIYLSGVIANPLKRLAKAAEAVRTGHSKGSDLPDLGYRHDEIGELSVALRSMIHALWERMDSIESFAADVAHELKNPLTSLRSAIETAERVKKKADKEKLMEIIRHDLERMDRLITDISSASRLDAELSREAFSRVDLENMFVHLLDFYRRPLKRGQQDEAHIIVSDNNVTLALDIQPYQTYLVMGLEDRLGQVFRNIIDNAISFAPEGSQVNISMIRESHKIKIAISDEGIGIPENKLETIFERFYSERPDDEGYGQHSGLGLSICKQIIDAHNGDITAENIKDGAGRVRGAQFTVTLNAA